MLSKQISCDVTCLIQRNFYDIFRIANKNITEI